MNTIKSIFLSLGLFILINCSGDEVTKMIKTPTIQCGMCQKTIEMGLKKIPGVSSSHVDLGEKITKVVYDIEKTNQNTIEDAIANLGYQANEIIANPIAYAELPACCKIGGGH